jgi:quinol monooxygenase YgiN
MILVIGRVRCAEDQRDELVSLCETMQNESRREEGCLRYGFFAAVEDPLSFV